MRETWLVQRQRTAGAYLTIKIFYRKQDARDYLAAEAALNPEYPYDGGDTYAYGPSKHNKTRFRIVEQARDTLLYGSKGLKQSGLKKLGI